MAKSILALTGFVLLLASGFCQDKPKMAASNSADDAQHDPPPQFPVRRLEFKKQDSPASVTVSTVMTFPSQCTSDGSLFLDMVDTKDLGRHTVLSIHGKETKTYQPSAISDLSDVTMLSFYPSDDAVSFLVRASKEKPGPRVPGKSPAGIAWKDYHNFIARFDRSGQYKGSVQLPMEYTLSHFAVLASGEYIVTGYDKLNSTVRLLFLKQSGEILKSLDMPASRDFAEHESGDFREAEKAGRQLLGSIVFTGYKNDVLVWRMNSTLPILDVGPGATVREVSLQPPSGEVFVDLVPSNDRWVAHFRSEKVRENARENQMDFSYYDVNPYDGGITYKLLQSGEIPNTISCESDGKYIAFEKSDDDKVLTMLSAE